MRALLVLHSPVDDIVSIDNASGIFQTARHPKSFVSLDHADHLLTRKADADYAAAVIAAWASRYVGDVATAEGELAPPTQGLRVEETGGGQFQVRVTAASGSFLADEPVSVGGLGSGPTPYDLLGAGLGACTAMTLRLYADRKGWPLERVVVEVGGKRLEVVLPASLGTGAGPAAAKPAKAKKRSRGGAAAAASGNALTSPMQGTIVKVAVGEGDTVAEGDLVVVLEAMKMEQPLTAHRSGIVIGLAAAAGETVSAGAIIALIEDAAGE